MKKSNLSVNPHELIDFKGLVVDREEGCSYNWPSAISDGHAGLSGTHKKKTLCLCFLQGDFNVLDFVQFMSVIPACTKSWEWQASVSSDFGSEVTTVHSMGQLLLQVKTDFPVWRVRHS